MATMTLHPTQLNNAASSYLTITDQNNMYTDTSSTTYATIQNTNASTSNRYIYLKGFNFDDLPTGAEVSSFTVKIKGYYSGGSQQTLYLCNNTTTQTGATATGLTTTTQTRGFSNGSLTWDTISSWGDDFSIRINCRRGNRNTVAYYYIYGAEIEVTYTLPVFYDITTSTTTGTISPSGTTSVREGENFTLTIEASNPTVTDNNIDVTSQIQRITDGSTTYIPYDYSNTGFNISNINNAYSDITDSTYADCSLSGRTTGNLYLDLGPVNLPSSATITNVTCQASLQITRNNSSSSMTASCQMYSGNTSKGSSTTLVSSAQDVARTTYTLNIGSWTTSELENARFYLTMYNGASSTVRHVYVYGISFTITYTISGEVYTYTLTNVRANHTIIVNAGSSPSKKIYVKINNTWTQYSKVYKKVNGSWVEQSSSTWATLFDTNTNYRKME